MSFTEGAVVAAIVFVAALLQVTLFATPRRRRRRRGRAPAGVALDRAAARLGRRLGRGVLRRPLVDVLTLDTLGVSALLYALAGYWAGATARTGRDRSHAPLLTVLVATIAIAYVGYGLHFLLGEELSGASRSSRRCSRPSCSTSRSRSPSSRSAARRSDVPRSPIAARGEAPWLAPTPSAARRRGASCRPIPRPPSRTASRRSSRCGSASSPASR